MILKQLYALLFCFHLSIYLSLITSLLFPSCLTFPAKFCLPYILKFFQFLQLMQNYMFFALLSWTLFLKVSPLPLNSERKLFLLDTVLFTLYTFIVIFYKQLLWASNIHDTYCDFFLWFIS